MTRYGKLIIILSLILISSYTWADSKRPPSIYVTTSESKAYYFKMIPGIYYKGKTGICYEATANDADRILWKTNGWYSYKVYLSNDSRYLVRAGNWPSGEKLSDQHLAIAFYKEGKLLKKYSTKDLVKDPSAIELTVSHYFWKAGASVFDSSKQIFQLTTRDKIEYTFDITNGEIISQKKVALKKRRFLVQ
jgi:hypothetical protein